MNHLLCFLLKFYMVERPSLAAFPDWHNALLKCFRIPIRQMQVHALPAQCGQKRRRRASFILNLFLNPSRNNRLETVRILRQHLDESIIYWLPPGSTILGQVWLEVEDQMFYDSRGCTAEDRRSRAIRSKVGMNKCWDFV